MSNHRVILLLEPKVELPANVKEDQFQHLFFYSVAVLPFVPAVGQLIDMEGIRVRINEVMWLVDEDEEWRSNHFLCACSDVLDETWSLDRLLDHVSYWVTGNRWEIEPISVGYSVNFLVLKGLVEMSTVRSVKLKRFKSKVEKQPLRTHLRLTDTESPVCGIWYRPGSTTMIETEVTCKLCIAWIKRAEAILAFKTA